MPVNWCHRRAHSRRLRNGSTINIAAAWVSYEIKPSQKPKPSYRRHCPECGAAIVSVRMPNGGMAHFEGRRTLSRVKHPCLNRGERLSKIRDPDTLDLFQDEEE